MILRHLLKILGNMGMIILLAASAQPNDLWKIFGDDAKTGSGNLETVELDLKSFERIKSSGSFDIIVTIDDEQKVLLTIDDNLIDNIKARVKGKTLRIGSRGSFSTSRGGKFEITVPSLERVSISGSGTVEVRDLDAEEFELRVSGSGDITAQGRVEYLEISVSGSGEIDTRDLKAENVFVKVSGSGDADVFASDEFRGSVSGSGDITYYGNPKHANGSTSGSGRIRKR